MSKRKKLVAEIRNLDNESLNLRLEDKKRELFNFKFQLATGSLEDVSLIEKTKREIAIIKTILSERNREEFLKSMDNLDMQSLKDLLSKKKKEYKLANSNKEFDKLDKLNNEIIYIKQAIKDLHRDKLMQKLTTMTYRDIVRFFSKKSQELAEAREKGLNEAKILKNDVFIIKKYMKNLKKRKNFSRKVKV